MKNKTDQLIVRYLYNELSDTEREEFIKKLAEDPELQENVHQLSSIVGQVDEIKNHCVPKDSTIEKILDFSRNYKPKNNLKKK